MKVTKFPDLSRAREEAAALLARLDRGAGAKQQLELRRWCMDSPANARALRQLSELWGSLDVLAEVVELLPGETRAAFNGGTNNAARRRLAAPRKHAGKAPLARAARAAGVVAEILRWWK